MQKHSSLLVCLVFWAACNSTTASKGPPAAAPASPQPTSIATDLKLNNLPRADPREPRLAAGVTALLEREHVKRHRLDDELAKSAFATYIDRLDPGKLFLLKEHVTTLERDATRMDDELRSGDFRLARVGSALLVERQKKVAALVAELLRTPFDFNVEEALETDPDKRAHAASEAELEDLWRRTLKQQVLERIDRMEETAKGKELKTAEAPKPEPKAPVEPPPPTFEGREKKAREELAKSYNGRFIRLSKREALEPAESFINAFTAVFDPHTLYLAPAQQANFDIEVSGSLEGIGAVLSEDDHFVLVREIVPGGAAWRQGILEEGDLILAVKQTEGEPVDVGDMRINDVVKMIRGPKGTVVTLTVKKPDERVLTVAITRDVVVVEAAYARGALLDLGPKTDPAGYIYLPSFYGNTRSAKGQTPERDATDDVRALLQRFAAKKVSGVVLDLRGNGGGLLNHATGIAGLFIDQGPVVQARNADDNMQVLGDEDAGVSFGGELIVLVDRFSASASEILAGALQDYRRALIVGTGPTHGKGTVQALIDLDRMTGGGSSDPLGVMKLTIQQFFLVDGESTQWKGVQPDITLPDPASHVESGERYLDHAIPWSKVEALPATPWAAPRWDRQHLYTASQERQAKEGAFSKIRARGEYLGARREQTLVALKREAWTAQRDKDRDELEKLDPKLDEGTARFSVETVDYRPSVPNPADARPASSSRIERWQETLAHDPWIEETLFLLAEMTSSQSPTKVVPTPGKKSSPGANDVARTKPE